MDPASTNLVSQGSEFHCSLQAESDNRSDQAAPARLGTVSVQHATPAIQPVLRASSQTESFPNLNRRDIQAKKAQLCRLIDQYNDNPESCTDSTLLACLSQRYGMGINFCYFSDSSLRGASSAKTIDEYDDHLLQAIEEQNSFMHKTRSLAIARMMCWLVKDASRLTALEHFADRLYGEDLAYIARHSRPEIAHKILTDYLDRLSADAFCSIGEVHPALVKPIVLDSKKLMTDVEIPQLLTLCLNDSDLADSTRENRFNLQHIRYDHVALLCLTSIEKATALFEKLDSMQTCNPSLCFIPAFTNAIRLLMVHRSLAERWMTHVRENLPGDGVPMLLAEVASRYPDLIKDPSDITTILTSPRAAFFLLYENLRHFLTEETTAYINQKLDHSQKYHLLLKYPDLAVEILAHSSSETVCFRGISELINQTPNALVQIMDQLYDRLDRTTRAEIHNRLKHPKALQTLRDSQGPQIHQFYLPYQEVQALLLHPERFDFEENTLLLKLRAKYPCLISAVWAQQKETPLSSDNQSLILATCADSTELTMDIMLSKEFTDKQKIDSAGNFQDTLMALLREPEQYLTSPDVLTQENGMLNVQLMKGNQKRSAIFALEHDYLNTWAGPDLFLLSKSHPSFSIALTNKCELLKKIPVYFLSKLCLDNPAFRHRLSSSPELSELWSTVTAFSPEARQNRLPFASQGDPTVSLTDKVDSDLSELYEQQPNIGFTRVSAHPEFRSFAQNKLITNHPDRLRQGGICGGLCLHYALWQSTHPNNHPTRYLEKIEKYCAQQGSWMHYKSLPEKLDFLQRQHSQFISEGQVISTVEHQQVSIDTRCLEKLLKQHSFIYLSQVTHACLIGLWNCPDKAGAQELVFIEPNAGIYCFTGLQHDENWTPSIHRQLDEVIKNHLLQYGKEARIRAHRIDLQALGTAYPTPVVYRDSGRQKQPETTPHS